jgi:hypothetical protein
MALSVSPQVVALKQLRADLSAAPWPILPLGDPEVAEINPKIDLKALDDDTPVSFLPMEAVEENTNTIHPTVRPVGEVRKGYTAFADNDVIWAKITPCMQNGKSALVRGLMNGVGSGSTEFHVLRAGPKTLPEFLWALLSMPRLLFAAQGAFAGSSGHQRVPASFLEELHAPIPPLSQQRHLVALLLDGQERRDIALSKSRKIIREINSFVMNELGLVLSLPKKISAFATKRILLENRLDPFFYSPPFLASERQIAEQSHVVLDELVKFSNKIWDARSHPEASFDYIEISGVDRVTGRAIPSRIAVENAPSRARMITKPGDILVSLTRPHHGSIALLENQHEGCIASTGFAVICDVDKDRTTARFVWTMLRLSICLDQMLRRSSGGNYPAITQDELAKVLIPLPDKATQQRICDEVERRHIEARKLENEAQSIWQAARQQFEDQLLNGLAP